MEIISVIAGLLLIVVWVGTIIGLINPKWLQGKKENSKLMTRKEIGLGCIGATVLLGIIGAVSSPSSEINIANDAPEKIAESQAAIASETSKEPLKELPVEANLGLAPEEFREKLNKELKKADIETLRPLAEFDIEEGKVRNTAKVKITDGVSMLISINKDGQIREILYMMRPTENTTQTGLELLLLSTYTAHVLNPETADGTAGSALIHLITVASEDIDKEKNMHTKIFGNNQYYTTASKELGLWVGVSPVRE